MRGAGSMPLPRPLPFALSLAKGFDKLSPNGA